MNDAPDHEDVAEWGDAPWPEPEHIPSPDETEEYRQRLLNLVDFNPDYWRERIEGADEEELGRIALIFAEEKHLMQKFFRDLEPIFQAQRTKEVFEKSAKMATDAKKQQTAEYWASWQSLYRELRDGGKKITHARRIVAKRMVEQGLREPSKRTLEKQLRD